jgi:hypothetical protein
LLAGAVSASEQENIMRALNTIELAAVAGGVNPHLIAVNPGGQSNRSTAKNPNTTIIKTTGKLA